MQKRELLSKQNINKDFFNYRIEKAEKFLFGSAVCFLIVLSYFIYSDIFIRQQPHFLVYRMPILIVIVTKLIFSIKSIRKKVRKQLILVYTFECIGALFMVYGITLDVFGTPLFRVAILATSLLHLLLFLYNILRIEVTLSIIWGFFGVFFLLLYQKAKLLGLVELLVDIPNLVGLLIGVSILAFLRYRDIKKEFNFNRNLEIEKERSDTISRQLSFNNRELLASKEEIESQNEEILNQRNYIEKQRDQLEYRNQQYISSLNNAYRLQHAIENNNDVLHEKLNLFIFNQPKDVVSGDFTWLDSIEGRQFVIVSDCTGHGVTGALLSMLGTSLLNQIIKTKNIFDPAKILYELNKEFLKLYDNFSSLNDGMDLSVVVIYSGLKGQTKIKYAGARSPLVLIKKDEIEVIKPNKISVGESQYPTFITHEIIVEKGTHLFQFTDGYRDQIGGPKNKKLMSKGFYELLLFSIEKETMKEKIELFDHHLKQWKNEQVFNEQIDDILVLGYQL